MRRLHSIRLSVLAFSAAIAAGPGAWHAAAQSFQPASFTVFQRGTSVGTEEVALARTDTGWTVTSTGRYAGLDLVLRALQIRYDADWQPIDLAVDATLRQQTALLKTTVAGNVATTELTAPGGTPSVNRVDVPPQAVLLVNPYVGPYAALAARLKTAPPGMQLALHQPGGTVGTIRVGETTTEQIQTLNGIVRARRTRIEAVSGTVPALQLEIWSDDEGRLLRVSSPSQLVDYVREDLASVSARVVTSTRANDEDVRIPANGFSLAGTLSKPTTPPGPRGAPAVILLSGAGPTDRDETIAGIPIFGQLADAIANAGFYVLRYDKRGVGQSGGRPDAATLSDFAEDARAAVRFLSERKDVDKRRIAVIGHSEGGAIALLAARDHGRIAAVGLLSTSGTSGADLNLYRVGHQFDRGSRPAAEKTAALALQKQIQTAVITGKGWDSVSVPPATRAQADTPYFQSFLTMDPAATMKGVDQPLLILQGELDPQLPPANAETLATLARGRKKAAAVDVVAVPGVNHLLTAATTGETDEYSRLPERRVSAAVTTAVTEWLQKTLIAR